MNSRMSLVTRMSAVIAATLVAIGTASAQDVKLKTTVSEPVLPRMPLQSAWKIDYFQNIASSSQADVPDPAVDAKPALSITIRKDNQTYHLSYDREMGGYRDVWVIEGVAVALAEKNGVAAIVPSVFFPATDFSKSDFEDFEWVTAKNFTGLDSRNDVDLLKFESSSVERVLSARERFEIASLLRQQQARKEDSNENSETSPLDIRSPKCLKKVMGWGDSFSAWLTPGEQRPVRLWNGNTLLRVTLMPDVRNLKPPAAVLERLQIEKEKINRLSVKRNRRAG